MTFSKPWAFLPADEGGETPVPLLGVGLRTTDGRWIREHFVVDSGADVSMAPRGLCELLGLAWEAGTPVQLRGISPRDECKVTATVHPVEVLIQEANCRITIPFCFADGDAPSLLGREGFFDAFRVIFDKKQQLTTFELLTV
jgi:hypothetical protein